MKFILTLIFVLAIILPLYSCSDYDVNTDENFDTMYQDILDLLYSHMLDSAILHERSISHFFICEHENRVLIGARRRDRNEIRSLLYENIESFNSNMIRFERFLPPLNTLVYSRINPDHSSRVVWVIIWFCLN